MNVEGATAAVASSTALERIPPVEAVNELNKAHTLHAIGGDLRPMFNVPVHMLGLPASHRTKTAYEFVKDYNMRSMVSSAVGDAGVISQVTSSNLIGALQDLKSLVTSYLGLRDQAGLIFKVVFTDGSYVQFTVDIDSPLGTYIEDSARTAAGQAIPSSIDDVRGTWTNGGGDNLGPMADHFGRLGATMTFVGAAGGAITSIVCSGVGAEKVCRVTRVIY
ncbi:hypothetical protein [Luteimonas huabeiensis]|uniref:hypothetical protein n=1 Tax=Luteimonas huabeiensis TaxID=1244513 RepID=UPI001F418637|nr:hypothetical protein [Luteimonas huabeiensis]